MMAVMVGIKSSRHSCIRHVGTGSGMHGFFGALRTMFFTCCSVTREKVSRLGPQKTDKSGCPDVASGSSLSLWVFGRLSVGMEPGRVLSFFLPDNWSVMWTRSLLEQLLSIGHIVLFCLQEEFLRLLAVVGEDLPVHSKS